MRCSEWRALCTCDGVTAGALRSQQGLPAQDLMRSQAFQPSTCCVVYGSAQIQCVQGTGTVTLLYGSVRLCTAEYSQLKVCPVVVVGCPLYRCTYLGGTGMGS